MNTQNTLDEFRTAWLPHVTDAGLVRLIELLESGSPLLIHGAFSKACAMGCLATHIAWHHPLTRGLNEEAGVCWLTRVAKLNPATSLMILAWDRGGQQDWSFRTDLLKECRDELSERLDPNWTDKPSDSYSGISGVLRTSFPIGCDTR